MGDFQDVWAVGAGAVTKLLSPDRKEGKRIDTVKNVDQYIERIDEMIERKRKYFAIYGLLKITKTIVKFMVVRKIIRRHRKWH